MSSCFLTADDQCRTPEYLFPLDDMPSSIRESAPFSSGENLLFLLDGKKSIVVEHVELDGHQSSLPSTEHFQSPLEETKLVVVEQIKINSSKITSPSATSSDRRYYPYTVEFPPDTKNVQRGGFVPLNHPPPQPKNLLEVFRRFPPYPNSRYELTSNSRFHETERRDCTFISKTNVPVNPNANSKQTQEEVIQNKDASSNKRSEFKYSEALFEPVTRDNVADNAKKHGFAANETSYEPVTQYDNASIEKELTFRSKEALYKPNKNKDGLTKGERFANAIDWDRPTWVNQPPGASGPILPPKEMREEFIKLIDSSARMLFCKKCEKAHIPPGPPTTLPDRDTCSSMLPEWFPTEGFEKPWETFIQLLNEIIVLDEMEQGFTHRCDPSKPVWGLKWHEKDPKWRSSRGRREGWWKCRSGADAPEAEQNCQQCHVPMTPEEEATEAQRTIPTADRKAALIQWITARVREGGLKDRAAVEERDRMLGIPTFFVPSFIPQQATLGKRTIVATQREITDFEEIEYDRLRGDFDPSPKASIHTLNCDTSSKLLLFH